MNKRATAAVDNYPNQREIRESVEDILLVSCEQTVVTLRSHCRGVNSISLFSERVFLRYTGFAPHPSVHQITAQGFI